MNRNMKESLIGGRNVPHRRGLSINKTSKDMDENMDLFSHNHQSLSVISSDESDHQRNKSFPFVLIDENGTLNDAGLADFGKEVKMAEGGVPYFLISIIGPQSSGKSTLLNHAFGTNFLEMDANTTRSATTHGIWLAKSPNADNCTLVMDLEGSDGNKRGEDGTTFEKQAALFAFAVSDIVLINMWSHSVGLVHAASMPLLRNVFEATRKLKIHDSKTTLWFVLRDHTMSPINVIENYLWKDILQAWDSVAMGTPLSNCFEVKITILPHYVYERQQFEREVVNLRQKLLAELTINGKKMRPSSGFSLSVQDLWRKIKEDKDLDLPARRVMVAKVQCGEIADKILSSFGNEDCPHLQQAVQSGQVKDFGKSFNLILNEHLSAYDKETEYYDEGVRTKKRRELHDTMMKLAEPACDTMLKYIHSEILNEFKEEFPKVVKGKRAFDKQAVDDYIELFMTKFDKKCKDTGVNQYYLSSSKSRARLLHDIITHATYSSVKTNKVNLAAVGFGLIGAAGLAVVGVAAGIKLGPAGFPIAVACVTGFAQLAKETVHLAI